MVISLEYKDSWDSIPREKLSEAYYCAIALSCALDISAGIKNHIEIIQEVINTNPDKSNRDIWYLSLLYLLKARTKAQKSYYVNKLLQDMIIKYTKEDMPDNIANVINQINQVIPYEGFFITIADAVSKEDPILDTLVSTKEEIRAECEKYFVFKNVNPGFLESTILPDYVNSEYINQFDLLFDVLVMFYVQTLEEIFMSDCYSNESDVRAYIFSAVEQYATSIFTKNISRITNKICSILAKHELAIQKNYSVKKEG